MDCTLAYNTLKKLQEKKILRTFKVLEFQGKNNLLLLIFCLLYIKLMH